METALRDFELKGNWSNENLICTLTQNYFRSNLKNVEFGGKNVNPILLFS